MYFNCSRGLRVNYLEKLLQKISGNQFFSHIIVDTCAGTSISVKFILLV